MEAKRRKSNPDDEPPRTDDSRDCYNQVLYWDEDYLPLYFSWFRSVEAIGQNIPYSPLSLSEKDNLHMSLHSLSTQLAQVKRRIGPAAERSTEAKNSSFNKSVATTGYKEFLEARRECNPFEALGEGRNGGLNNLFMNRSAIKLANIDALNHFALTRRSFGSQGPFIFVDLCGAPGGFSEYIMTRCRAVGISHCWGYGMSLTGTNENGRGTPWKLRNFDASESGIHTTYKIFQGVDQTGDIYNWANVEALRAQLLQDHHCSNCDSDKEEWKAQLVLADGGFDGQRNVDNQEEVTQKMVVCEVAAGLNLLRKGGTMVIKLFGFQTPVVRAMMTDLYFLFERITALKPITSRPASAERYVLCSGFRGTPDGWNGPRWRDQMFLSHSTTVSPTLDPSASLFCRYLDEFDRDMLVLNLKACFAILSYLEINCLSMWSDSSSSSDNSCTTVDIQAYRHAWQLS